MHREVTLCDFERREVRELSGFNGNKGSLVGLWFCVAATVILGFIVVETTTTITGIKIQKLLLIL